MRFRDLRIGTKQAIGFGLILVIMAGINLFTISRMNRLKEEIDLITRVRMRQAIAASNLNRSTWNLRIAQLRHAYAQSPTDSQVSQDNLVDLLNEIVAEGDTWDSLSALVPYEARAKQLDSLWAQYEQEWDEYFTRSVVAFEEPLRVQQEAAQAYLSGTDDPQFTVISDVLDQMGDLAEQDALDAARAADETVRETRIVIRTLLLLTIVFSVLIAGWLVSMITEPIRELVIAARTVARGNLNIRLSIPYGDEIGHLSRSFNQMTDALQASQEQTQSQAEMLRQQRKELQVKNEELEQKSQSLDEQRRATEQQNEELETALHQLQQTQQQLILNEKMASLGQLTAGIAHEIKNPLNFVNNFARLSIELASDLQEILDKPEEERTDDEKAEIAELFEDLRQNARRIQEHGRRADGIVHSMLAHSRSTPGERKPVDINYLLDEYVNLAYHGKRAQQSDFHVTLQRDFDTAVGKIPVIQQEIGRVFLNLLDNAFYVVYARTQRNEPGYEPTVTVSTQREGSRVFIRISDNGGGISAEAQERIFQPFFSTKPTGAGTGLGLSLSYDIVTQGHGGLMRYQTEEGEGTTFEIELPATAAVTKVSRASS